jgi:hypothetical protein
LLNNSGTLANTWRNPVTIAKLSPFGRRLLALWPEDDTRTARQFSRDMGLGAPTFEAHLTKQLSSPNRTATRMKVEEAIKYARSTHVSLTWLLTGEGRRSAEGYGLEGDEMLKKYPEPLQRAARALTELHEEVTPDLALDLTKQVFQDHGDAGYASDVWLHELQSELRRRSKKSGTRPSTKIKTAK